MGSTPPSLTMASLDKIPVSDVMPFIISQVLGGLVAVQLRREELIGSVDNFRRGRFP
jgi:hypothetical protein